MRVAAVKLLPHRCSRGGAGRIPQASAAAPQDRAVAPPRGCHAPRQGAATGGGEMKPAERPLTDVDRALARALAAALVAELRAEAGRVAA